MDVLDRPLREIHDALKAGVVTSASLVELALSRAKANKDNCFESILENEAKKASEDVSLTDSWLSGVPYLTKDNFSVEGIKTCASSEILKGYRPLYDATVIKKLKDAGSILIGQTTMDELAMGGTGSIGHLGKTFNPYDPNHQRMIGGSSSGSASAVASGVVPFATGSDTGDSVRRPAALGGLVGVKPTWGRISRYGLFPFAPSLDHVGYFTRYVEDAAYLLGVLSGYDENDMTSSRKPVDDYLGHLEDGVKGRTFVRISDIEGNISDARYMEAMDKLCRKLEEEGAKVISVPFGKEMLESLYPTYIVISCAEATSNDANLDGIKFGPYKGGNTYVEEMTRARTEGFGELIKRRFVIGSFALMRENRDELFIRAQKIRAKVVDRLHEILKDADALLVPTTSSVAPLFEGNSDRLSDEYLIADNHLCLANFGGLPSMSQPLAMEYGLPLGVSLTMKPFEEAKMFTLARAIEKITGLAGLSTVNRLEGNL